MSETIGNNGIVLPDGTPARKEEEVTPEEAVTVTIIKDPRGVTVDVKELKAVKKDHTKQTGIISKDIEVMMGIQMKVAQWANWLAVGYVKMPRTIDNALEIIGYKITKLEETSRGETADQHSDGGEGEH